MTHEAGIRMRLAAGVAAGILCAAQARAAVITHTTSDDFSKGTLSSAVVVNLGGGAVRLMAGNDAWQLVTAPNSRDFYGVYMDPGGEGWAVGQARQDAVNSYNVIFYDRTSWSEEQTMSQGYDLYGIWMPSSIEGWVGGGYGRFVAYDRPEWLWEVEYSTHSQDQAVYGVHMLDNTQGWATGKDGELLEFDGSGWYSVESPTDKALYGIFTVSAAEAWAVGQDGAILRYDGSSWSAAQSPISETLNSVFMIDASNGRAVGALGKIIRYNGTTWEEESSPTGNNLASVWMVSPDEGWAVGDGGCILKYDGISWSQASSPTGEALKGVSCGSAERCLAVGLSGTLLRYLRDYVSSGALVSQILDGGTSPDWGALSWTASGTDASTQLKFQLSSAQSTSDPALDAYLGPDGSASSYYTTSGTAIWSGHDGNKYMRYKAVFSTADPLKTPLLESVSVTY